MGLLRLLWTVLLAGHAALGWAQAPQFASISVPRGVVAGLAQDRDGFIWIGSGDGPLRYDGHTLRSIETSHASRRNLGWIRAFLADAQGRMWMGTERDGLVVYDPNQNRVRQLHQKPQAPIRSLAQDGSGRIWIGSDGDGLTRYDPAQNLFETLPLHGPEGRVQNIQALMTDAQGRMWIGHDGGLSRWDPGVSNARLQAKLDRAFAVQTLLQDPQGRIWFGLDDGRLAWVDEHDRVQWLTEQREGALTSLAIGPQGELWVGRRVGLDRLDLHSLQWAERLQFQPGLAGGLAGNEITSLLRSHDGALWVGGFGLGLQRHRHNPFIQVRGADADVDSPLHRPDIRALVVRQRGDVLAATHGGTLARLDAALRTVGRFPSPGPAHVEAMLEDPEQRLWMVSHQALFLCNGEGRPIRQWPLQTRRVNRLRWQGTHTLWLMAESGLWKFDTRQDAAPALVRRKGGTATQWQVWAIEDDGEGGLWVGSAEGLHRWRPGTDALEGVSVAPDAPLGFTAVLGLLRSTDGTLWLDTPVAGLHRLTGWDAQGRARFDRISERHGQSGRPFGANLHQDGRGRIWSQSFVYDPQLDRLDAIGPADGARFGTPWFFVHADMGDGRWLFGGSQGLLVVEPNKFDPRRDAPQVWLSDLRLDGKSWETESLQEGLTLPPHTQSLTLRFAALDFDNPEQLHYRYRLANQSSEWSASDPGQATLTFTQLAPGTHQLQVQARRAQGDWGTQWYEITLRQQPKLWQRNDLRAALLLGLAGIGLWALRWRTRRLHAREVLLQSLVEARTAELREASLTDPLTGLHNRRYLTQRIHQDLNLCLRLRERHEGAAEGSDLMVILLDLDHFKHINDRYGHDAGDAILVQTAERLRQVFRNTDSLVRWGGEEFLVVTRASSRKHTAEVLDRLRTAFHQTPFVLPDGQPVPITHSAGLAMFPLDPEAPLAWDWDRLLRLVDQCLYEAKARGRDGWVAAIDCYGLHPDALPTHLWLQDPRLSVQRSAPHQAQA